MRDLIAQEGLENLIEVDSAGTIDFHTGSPPDHRMREVGRGRGIRIGGQARQIQKKDLTAFDLILTMDRDNHHYVEGLDSSHQYRDKIQYFCDFVQESEASEVPDPYYGGESAFHRVLDLLEDGCRQILEQIRDGRWCRDGGRF